MRSWSMLWIFPVSVLACSVSPDDLALSTRISDESIKVTNGAFAGLEGSFQLRLALGSEANGSTQVSLPTFELQNEAGERLADLSDATPEPMFPISLNKGE